MDPVTVRALERVIAVAIGGLSIYLGYRLFLHMPEQKDSEGKVNLPGGISIYMSRVGPGAFFALFGAILVAASFPYAVSVKETSSPAVVGETVIKGPAASVSKSYTGLGGGPIGEDEEVTASRTQVRTDIRFVNTVLPRLVRSDITGEQRNDLASLLPRVKLEMLKTVWGPDLGDFDAFRRWVQRGAQDPIPQDLKEAASYYREGQGARP